MASNFKELFGTRPTTKSGHDFWNLKCQEPLEVRFAGKSSEELNIRKLYLCVVQEVKGVQIGMGDIEPADKSTAPNGYGMPMMNM
jgi:hypothetical protein